MAKANVGKLYVGLTDDPERRKAEHGNPLDWHVMPFSTEPSGRTWEKLELERGAVGGPGGKGWEYGYSYTITDGTSE